MNLSLLLPEWSILAVLLTLLAAEIVKGNKPSALEDVRSFSVTSFVGCCIVGFISLIFLKKDELAFEGHYLADPLAGFFKTFFISTLFMIVPITYRFFLTRSKRLEEFYLISWTTLLGMFFLASSNDLLLLFISLEIVTLSFYIMAAFPKKEMASIEAGLKYLIIGSLASAFVIFGISLIYFVVGSTHFSAVNSFLQNYPHHKLLIVGILLVLTGACFKVSSVPFHLWVPDVYQGAPIPTVAFLSVASKAAGFLMLVRLLFTVFPVFNEERQILFSGLAAMTIIYGSLGALRQRNFKRLLGYSSIGHAGYMLIAVATGQRLGISSLLFYLLTYAASNLTIFFVLAVSDYAMKNEEISSYRGLYKRSPFLAACLFISVLSLAGIPGTAGFFGKFFVLLAAVKGGQGWLALLGALAVAVSLFYYLNLIRTAYAEEPLDQEPIIVSSTYKLLLSVLLGFIFVLGLYPQPFIKWTTFAAGSLF